MDLNDVMLIRFGFPILVYTYSIDFSKMNDDLPEVLDLSWSFLNLNLAQFVTKVCGCCSVCFSYSPISTNKIYGLKHLLS